MQYELEEIKKLRKRHNLTQSELSRLSGVSQSLIAKIESGNLDPSYSKVKKILEVLNNLNEKQEAKAYDFMQKKLIFCSKAELVTDAAKKMRKFEISQIPVMEKSNVIGLISESDILEKISEGGDIARLKVGDVMEEAPPVISKNAPMKMVIELLKFSPLLVVADGGEFAGVITKADVLKKI